MAPVTGSQQEEGYKAKRVPRRSPSGQRITRNMDSEKSVRDLSVEPRDGGARREDRNNGRDDRQRREHRDGGNRQRDEDESDLSSTMALTITYSPTATLDAVAATIVSASSQSTVDVLMTSTQYVEIISAVSGSSQTRQGSVVTVTSTSGGYMPTTCGQSGVQETLFAYEDGTPNPNVSFDDVDNGYDGDNDHGDDHGNHGSSPGGLDPSAEHALISVGSIGGFIIVCFAIWIAWRMVKKSQRKADGIYGNKSSPPTQVLSSITSLGRAQRGWQGLDDTPNGMLGSPPGYEKNASISQAREVYATNDPASQQQLMAKQGPTVLPQLQTNFSPSNTVSPYSTPIAQNQQTVSPLSQMSQAGGLPQLQTNLSPAGSINPFANTLTSSVNAANPYLTMSPGSNLQYGGTMGTAQTAAMTETDRSLMAHPFYNQSELARQPSNAYDPARRQVYRASELSSLSSGFGDGDIIMPPPAALQQSNAPGMPRFTYQQAPGPGPGPGPVRKDSVANASEAGSGNRDTVYTTTSEDMPRRYRTVNSWVNQQTGRVHRAAAAERADEGAPPVPVMPPEERYTMMMDDDEEPRRPDTVPVPALPEGAANVPAPTTAESKETNP